MGSLDKESLYPSIILIGKYYYLSTKLSPKNCVDLFEVQSIFQNNPNEFLILMLNIQSVNAKFNN